ncbi:hypothetical protein BY996DRAFT_7027932 [Phakopsora pachyrhizi]|nr:hypothetical protein BY996DRAFT_7027932 [Phakopsora pachyrhizi]
MNSKIFLMLVVCTFFYTPSGASKSLKVRAEKGYHSSGHKGHGHKFKIRAETGDNIVTQPTINRSYGHHKYHHKGYSKHYRKRALKDVGKEALEANAASGKAAPTADSGAKASVVSRKHGHGHHKMHNAYHKGYRKHYRKRAFGSEKNKANKTQASTKKNFGEKKLSIRATPELSGKTASIDQTPVAKAGLTEKAEKSIANGTVPSQGTAVLRKTESYYRPKHYGYNGYRNSYY